MATPKTVIAVETFDIDTEVFDIEVSEDCSFVVAGIVLHNSPICASRAGKAYRHGEGPLPPAHVNCRSSVYNLVAGVGPADDIGYAQWFEQQDAEDQRDILGPTRYKLYRDGGLKVDSFTDRTGRKMTLDELKARDAAAFTRAGLEGMIIG